MYKTFTADGYRGLRTAELAEMQPINLITGRNNSGKSALLEALFLHAAGPFAAAVALQKVRPLRGQQPVDIPSPGGSISAADNPWREFFRDFDLKRDINLVGITDLGRQRVTLVGRPDGPTSSLPVPTAEVGAVSISSASLGVIEQLNEDTPIRRTQSVDVQATQPDLSQNQLASQIIGQIAITMKLEPPAHAATRQVAYVSGGRGGADLAGAFSQLRQAKLNIDRNWSGCRAACRR